MGKANSSQQRFISTLLSNKKMTNAQKEKLASLMTRDLGLNKKVQEQKSSDTEWFPIPDAEYHSPKDIMDFLIEYNQDPILKYTCHPIDDPNIINELVEATGKDNYSVEYHHKLISTNFFNLRKKYDNDPEKFLDNKVIMLMQVYIDGKTLKSKETTWSSLNIPYNWHSPELWKWSKENPGIVANPGYEVAEQFGNEGFKLPAPIISNLNGKKMKTFGDIVLYYKSLFHIKRDDSLRKKILYVYKNGYQYGRYKSTSLQENINLTFGDFDDNIELFTSVDKLLQAFVEIMRICINVQKEYSTELPHIEVGFYRETESNRVCFSVHHLNTEYRKTIYDAKKRIGDQQTELIKNKINGICDLFIQANFGNEQYAEINFWDGNPRTSKKISKIQGVKYIMKY